MAHKKFNVAQQYATGTGTGALTPGAVTSAMYRTFAAAGMVEGDTCYVRIQHASTAAEWEVCLMTLTGGTFVRTFDEHSSSATGSLISFSAGTKIVSGTIAAGAAVTIDPDGVVDILSGGIIRANGSNFAIIADTDVPLVLSSQGTANIELYTGAGLRATLGDDGLNVNGVVNITQSSGTDRAIAAGQTVTGTLGGPTSLNLFQIVSDNADVTTSEFVDGWTFDHTAGGAAMRGGRQAVGIYLTFAEAGNPANTNHDYSALSSHMIVEDDDGGTGVTAATAKGGFFATHSITHAKAAAINLLHVTAHEFNVTMDSGSSAWAKSLVTLSGSFDDAVKGTDVSSMIWAYKQAVTATTWTTGILFGSPGFVDSFPFDTNSTVLKVGPSGGGGIIGTGIDLSNVTITTAAYTSPGFSVDGSGFVIGRGLSSTGAISSASWTTIGRAFSINAATATDTSGSGTIATRVAASFGIPTLAAASAVTLTRAANVYIDGPPAAGTNTTITNSYALLVGNGTSLFVGNVFSEALIYSTPTSGDAHIGGTAATAADRAKIGFAIPTVGAWYAGADGSDSSKFKVAFDASFASPAIVITTANVITVGGTVSPIANDAAALGASGTAWSDLFLASGAVINFNAGNYTITHSSGALAFSAASNVITIANTGTSGSRQVLRLDGVNSAPAINDAILQDFYLTNSSAAQVEMVRFSVSATAVTAGAEAGLLTFATRSSGALTSRVFLSGSQWTPVTDGAMNLGATTNRWGTLHISSTINWLNGSATITQSSGRIIFSGNISPSANDGGSLGISGTAWSDAFFASGAVLNFNAGNYTITHSAGALDFSAAAGVVTLSTTGTSGSRQSLILNGVNSAPAANDTVYLSASLTNSTPAQKEVARLSMRATTVTAGAEAGQFIFSVAVAGAMTDRFVVSTGAMRASTDDTMALGAATVGWQGIYISSTRFIDFGNNNVRLTHSTGTLSLTDGANWAFGTTTGTKIGTSTTQKIGFFNATPIVKPTGVAVDAAGIHAALVSLGLIAA